MQVEENSNKMSQVDGNVAASISGIQTETENNSAEQIYTVMEDVELRGKRAIPSTSGIQTETEIVSAERIEENSSKLSQMDENVAAATSGIQIETENNSTEEIELVIDHVVGQIERVLQERRHTRPPAKPAPCHCKVPQELRDLNLAAYYPRVLFISPLRCIAGAGIDEDGKIIAGRIYFDFRDQILRYLETFLTRAKQRASLNDFVKLIEARYMEILGGYDTNLYPCPNTKPLLVRILLENAVFIIELFLRFYHSEFRDENDTIFSDPWKMHDIQKDLILVENQLPFLILREIYDCAFAGNRKFPSFLHLTCHFFSRYCGQNKSIQDVISPSHCHEEYISKLETAEHLTDLLRTLQLPSCTSQPSLIKHHIVEERLEEGQERGEYLYSAVLLREAGVKFKVGANINLCDITFRDGELVIPPLRVDELTESFFRNLMAWELCYYYPHETYICGYVFLVQYLIKSEEDVDLLVRRRIIINQLGSNKAVVTLFNDLCKNIKVERNPYAGLFRELNAHNAVRYHSWIATLKLQHFSTPWKGVATIAAVIFLVLTLIQTICAITGLN